jgi:hypothetical protein
MAKILDLIISYDVANLTELSVLDTTLCTSPDTISQVNGVRLLFQTVNSVSNTAEATVCEAWFEYEVLSGTAVANGQSYPTGSTMLFANDTTPTGTFTMQTTGRYGQYVSNQLPAQGLPYTFTPSQTGREAFDSIYFKDEVFSLEYYQYEDVYISGSTLVAGEYLVVGSLGQTVVIGSKTFYVGETFPAVGGEVISGSANAVLFSNNAQFSFATQNQSFNVYQSYLRAMSEGVMPNEPLQANLLQVAGLYASPTIAAQTTSGISLNQLQLNLDRINLYYALQLR